MITLAKTTDFQKSFKKLSNKLQNRTLERLKIFVDNPFDSILNNHCLHGEYEGCRSINITGNLRVVYEKTKYDTCLLLDIGTHSQLYE